MALSLDSVGRYVFVCAFSRPVRVHVRCSAALAVSGMELHHSILFLLSWTGPVSYRCILSCSMKNGKRLSHCFCGLFPTPCAGFIPHNTDTGFLVFSFLVFEQVEIDPDKVCAGRRGVGGGLFLSEWSSKPSLLEGRSPQQPT